MAAAHLPILLLLLLLTLLSSLHIHARDSQMFNKVIPTKVNENVVVKETPQENPNKEEPSAFNTKEQEPNFIPENENSYGLYGHEAGQLPPSTTTARVPNNEPYRGSNFPYNAKYLPKNYNPVAYVTEPEDFNDSSFEDKSYTNGGANNYYKGQQQDVKDSEFMEREYTTTTNRNNYYNNGLNNNFNVKPQAVSGTSFADRAYTTNTNTETKYNNNYYTGGRVNRAQPQGMSDTRFLENGKYYHDINTGKHSRHPVDNAKEFALRNQQYSTNEYYGNVNDNSYQYNNDMEGQEQYHDEEDMP